MTISATMSPSSNPTEAGLGPVLCKPAFRPRLARFDRPAIDLDEMMRDDGEDFVHIAYWSIVGRRATRSECMEWAAKRSDEDGKYALLEHLRMIAGSDGAANDYPRLMQALRRRRNACLPLIGPILSAAVNFGTRYTWPDKLFQPIRTLQKKLGRLFRKIRKIRKISIKLGTALNLPSRHKVRRMLGIKHAPPPTGTSARAEQIYEQLCRVIDSSGAQN